jgi:flavin reductase (DIM6/NTAB) family NADH-FMN oxidoreductase RutF
MISFEPNKMKVIDVQRLIAGAVTPRPIAFASTIDKDGNPNLSPFSFFNAFGANPAMLIFSPARRGRDNTTKHTLDNLREVPEVVINVVSFDMVEQVSLSSTEYAKGINEFEKAGFSMLASETIRPFRVKESPIQFECRVEQIIETGEDGGAGNLVICHIQKIHIDEEILDSKGNIDPNIVDLVGRMGEDYYVRTSGAALFRVEKPGSQQGVGIDALPGFIKRSKYLSGNELAILGGLAFLPQNIVFDNLLPETQTELKKPDKDLFCLGKEVLEEGNVLEAFKLLFLSKGKV